jgi:hypothetical protein
MTQPSLLAPIAPVEDPGPTSGLALPPRRLVQRINYSVPAHQLTPWNN